VAPFVRHHCPQPTRVTVFSLHDCADLFSANHPQPPFSLSRPLAPIQSTILFLRITVPILQRSNSAVHSALPLMCRNYDDDDDTTEPMTSPIASASVAAPGSISGTGLDETTAYRTMPNVPNANANRMYAVINASCPSTRRPRESCGASSIPMMTESLPVPKASPKAMRLQNSTVAHAKGMMPTTKTHTSLFCARSVTVDARAVVVCICCGLGMLDDGLVGDANCRFGANAWQDGSAVAISTSKRSRNASAGVVGGLDPRGVVMVMFLLIAIYYRIKYND